MNNHPVTVAALDNSYMTVDGKRYNLASPITHICNLAARCATRGIREIWVAGSVQLDTSPVPGWRIWSPFGEHPTYYSVRRETVPGDVTIHHLTEWSPWDWRSCETADCILSAVTGYSLALCPPRTSPGATGLALLEQSAKREWLRPMRADLSDILPSAPDCNWARPYDPTGSLHARDCNLAYLSVAASQSFGCGEPVEVREWDPDAYGLWEIAGCDTGGSPWDGAHFPSPWGGRHNEPEEWALTPHIRLALQLGWNVGVKRGWVWPERHQFMRGWAQRIWTARTALQGGPAEGAVKQTYRAAFGRFDLGNRQGKGGEWWDRPHWRRWIVAECYRRTVDRVRMVWEKSERLPVAIHTDWVCYAGDGGILDLPHFPIKPGIPGGYKSAGILAGDPHELHNIAAGGSGSEFQDAFDKLMAAQRG